MKLKFHRSSVWKAVTMPALLSIAMSGAQTGWAQSADEQPLAGKNVQSEEKAVQPTTLPAVEVSTGAIVKSTEGYVARKSFSATRTDTLLRDVPQSITVVTQDTMRDQNVQSITDVIRYVPGIVPSQGEGNRDAVIIRGSGTTTGDFYVDGLRDDVQYYRDLYNIDRVEVLKGSNGMIFGRGGSGGVINRVTKEAGWKPVREIRAEFGSYSHKRVAADLNQPINEMISARINGLYENSNSFRDYVDLERWGINPTLTFMPTEKTRIVLSGEYFYDRRTADRGIPSFGTVNGVVNSGRAINTGRSTFFGNPDDSTARVDAASFNSLIEHTFNDRITIRNRTRYADYDKFYQNVYANGVATAEDATGTVRLSAYNDTTRRENIFNQTDLLFRLDTWGISHEFMTGVEYGRQVTDNLRNTGFFNNGPTSLNVSVLNPVSFTPLTYRHQAADADNHSVVEAVAVYAQDQITIIPQVKAVLGIRYDNFDTTVRNNNTGQKIHSNDGLISPRVGLIYKPIEPVSIYGNYSLAYVPRAGDQLTSLTLSNETLRPEKFRNLEFGAKWDIRPDLALTAALFQLDRSNVIATDPNDAARSILVDGQRVRGAEIGVTGKITSSWSVMGGYAYTDAEIRKNVTGAQKGATVAQVPAHTFSLWNRYDFTSYLGVGLGVIHRGSIYAAVDNTVLLPSFTRIDAALFAQPFKNLRVQVNVENLANIDYAASAHNNNNILPGAPRIFRLTAALNF
ncbi:TonB-dependent siderophore receptor [Betaproteobacteria bacterium PRO4]|uniref:TonB-dependent receptor n=1 Tax=Nitrosomonas sp. TaxID=42353 RepID=UPI0025642E2F|nr:TonB-dependent siderophore receptor [Nitrosomonas sp.]MDL1867046.1 TonB-dependent siderophore receptor [Betaproteobacteria bacterium PRO4]